MKLITRIILMMTMLALCVACGVGTTIGGEPVTPVGDIATPPSGASPDIRGTITTIQTSADPSQMGITGTMLVEGSIEGGTKFDKASITINGDTRLFEQTGDERRPVTVDAFRVGQRVEAWFTGPVMESYPVQVQALEIVIMQRAGN